MNTPEWFGTIGVMNSAHMHRRGIVASLRRAMNELRFAARLRLRRVHRLRAEQHRRLPVRRPAQTLAPSARSS